MSVDPAITDLTNNYWEKTANGNTFYSILVNANPYRFLANNPLRYSDPTGRDDKDESTTDEDENDIENMTLDEWYRYRDYLEKYSDMTIKELDELEDMVKAGKVFWNKGSSESYSKDGNIYIGDTTNAGDGVKSVRNKRQADIYVVGILLHEYTHIKQEQGSNGYVKKENNMSEYEYNFQCEAEAYVRQTELYQKAHKDYVKNKNGGISTNMNNKNPNLFYIPSMMVFFFYDSNKAQFKSNPEKILDLLINGDPIYYRDFPIPQNEAEIKKYVNEAMKKITKNKKNR